MINMKTIAKLFAMLVVIFCLSSCTDSFEDIDVGIESETGSVDPSAPEGGGDADDDRD